MIEDYVFTLLKSSLFPEKQFTDEKWNADFDNVINDVFAEMRRQAVAAIPGKWLKTNAVSHASSWLTFCTVQQGNWVRVMYGQSQLLELLDKNNIPCVILKGASAAMAYPNPSLRSMGDVDFLVSRANFEKTAELLEANGYQLIDDKDSSDHHYGYSKDKVVFELHYKLGIVRDSDEQLLSLFETGIENREIRQTEGFSFPVLPEDLNGLVLLFHINQHLRDGLGLRQIIDWMMYIDKLSDDTWQNKLLPLLRKTGLQRLALTVTAMCQKYLGLRTIVENEENFPCDALMRYIMEKGNFGRKAGIEGKTASFGLSVTDGKRFFKRLQDGGMLRWKAAKEHKLLRPFAWIYQSFHIIGVLIKSKISPRKIVELRKQGMEERALIESMGLKIDRYIDLSD